MISKEISEYLQNKYIELESFSLKIVDGLFYEEELQKILKKIEEDILACFSETDDEYRIWKNNSRNRTIYHILTRSGQKIKLAGRDEEDEIREKMDAIKIILERNSKDVLRREVIFSSQQQYSAKRYILKILKSASDKIIIVDEYLDSTIFDLLEDVDDKISIQLLTGDPKSIFKSLLKSFVKLKKVVAKSSKYIDSSHSRYIIIDESIYYHLGASINVVDAENMKSFSIQRMTEGDSINDLNVNFKNWWNKGLSIE